MDVVITWQEGWYVILWSSSEAGWCGSLEEAVIRGKQLSDSSLRHANRMRARRELPPLPPARIVVDCLAVEALLREQGLSDGSTRRGR